MSGMLHRLLLAGTCLCIYGNPVRHPNVIPTHCPASTTTTDVQSEPPDGKLVSGPIRNGGAGTHGHMSTPEGRAVVTQAENGDRLNGKSGPSVTGRDARSSSCEVKKVARTSEMRSRRSEADADPEAGKEKVSVLTPTGGTEQMDMTDAGTWKLTSFGFQVSDATSRQPDIQSLSTRPEEKHKNKGRITLPRDRDALQDDDEETGWPSSPVPPNPSEWIQTSTSPVPPSVVLSPQTSKPFSIWSREGGTISTPPAPLLPEIGPNPMAREDSLDSLWTEAVRPSGGKPTLK